jgi:transposase
MWIFQVSDYATHYKRTPLLESTILQFIDGLRGDLQVTFEEGTSAAWLYDLLRPRVTKLVVCDPRKNASMREGSQSDKIDARRLAELLRLNHLSPVYHGEHGLRSLKELVRSYLTITKDLGRVIATPTKNDWDWDGEMVLTSSKEK